MNECPIHRDTPYNTYRRCTHIGRRHVSESLSTTRQTVWIAYFEDDEAGRPRCHTGGVIFTGDRVRADRVWDRCVAAMRADLSDAAKLLHGRLVSMHRMGASWTQTEIGASLGGWSRQKVWRAVSELVARGLLAVRRLGLGLPNAYTLLGLDSADLDGSAPRFRAGHPGVRPPQPGGRTPLTEKRTEQRSRIPTDARAYLAGPYGAVVRR